MRAPVGIVLGLAVVGVGCSSVTARAGLSPFPCGPPAARSLALTRVARVFQQGKIVYGCSVRARHSYRLGSAGFCTNSDRVGPIALAGEVAAYGVQRCGVDTGTAQVVVRRLSDGRVLHTAPATSRVPGAESYQSVASLVVKADGAVGWIGAAHSIIGHGAVIEVHRFDRSGQAQLDQGAEVGLRSLRLRGSQLTWLHSGSTRSASLS
jgi:hypothetical protein